VVKEENSPCRKRARALVPVEKFLHCDLGRIREGLIELVMSMSGMERERIEDFLAEADDADAN